MEVGLDDVPLNAEDMAGTLASFAVAPLWCLERMGIMSVSREVDRVGVARDYIRLWRFVLFP